MGDGAVVGLAVISAQASEADALQLDATIQARHLPFGTILDPVFSSPTNITVTGYTHCGDSGLLDGRLSGG